MLCLSSARKAPFPVFSACQQSCIILGLTKCQTARPSAEPGRGESGVQGSDQRRERAVIEHPHSDTDEQLPLFTGV